MITSYASEMQPPWGGMWHLYTAARHLRTGTTEEYDIHLKVQTEHIS